MSDVLPIQFQRRVRRKRFARQCRKQFVLPIPCIAATEGSAPRDVGASVLVWALGQSGTIGGGALEWEAVARAREKLNAQDYLSRIPLGPSLGQCCGGVVTLLCETYDAAKVAGLDQFAVLRRVQGDADVPISLKKSLQSARNSGQSITPALQNGWIIEPVSAPNRPLWIYGAGHVGRALVSVFAPLTEFEITWIDTAHDRFPDTIPNNVTKLIATNPADTVQYAPNNAQHLILTYSHALDLELCHQVLKHGFAGCGLIGSKTKWARFRKRLCQLGHTNAQINSICCPIGQPELGKQPQAIAIGVATTLMSPTGMKESARDLAG